LAGHLSKAALKRKSHLAHWLLGLVRQGETPVWKVLFEAKTAEELNHLEVDAIATARAQGIRLVNCSPGGTGWYPEIRRREAERRAGVNTNTPEHMVRLAEAKRGKPRSEETKARISAAKKGTPSPKKGVPMSEEQKAKVSASRKGKMTEAEHHMYRGDISTEAILKRLSEGATKVEIAQELGVSPTFVHRRVAQARRTLGEDALRSYKRRKNSPVPASM